MEVYNETYTKKYTIRVNYVQYQHSPKVVGYMVGWIHFFLFQFLLLALDTVR